MRRAPQKPETVIASPDPSSAPKESWWVGLDRAQLAERAEIEFPRMRRSKFGSITSFSTPTE